MYLVYHLTLIRIAVTKKTEDSRYLPRMGRKETLYPFSCKNIGAATKENSGEVSSCPAEHSEPITNARGELLQSFSYTK